MSEITGVRMLDLAIPLPSSFSSRSSRSPFFIVGRGVFVVISSDQNELLPSSSRQLFESQVIDAIRASTDNLGPFSVDFFRKNNLSTSWTEAVIENHSSLAESSAATSDKKQQSKGKQEISLHEEHPSVSETPVMLARKQLREKRREKRAADLVKQDDEVDVKLENAAIERSKSVNSAVLGKYSIWRKDSDSENSDSNVRLMRDQMIMARVCISLAKIINKLDLANELQIRLKESQRSVGDATSDSDLQSNASAKLKAMGQVLSKAREQLYDCKLVTGKLRAMLQYADDHFRSLKK